MPLMSILLDAAKTLSRAASLTLLSDVSKYMARSVPIRGGGHYWVIMIRQRVFTL
jgi:hypothetical protein